MLVSIMYLLFVMFRTTSRSIVSSFVFHCLLMYFSHVFFWHILFCLLQLLAPGANKNKVNSLVTMHVLSRRLHYLFVIILLNYEYGCVSHNNMFGVSWLVFSQREYVFNPLAGTTEFAVCFVLKAAWCHPTWRLAVAWWSILLTGQSFQWQWWTIHMSLFHFAVHCVV